MTADTLGNKVLIGGERFTPLAFLGRGATGFVYSVRDAEMGVDVALKTLPMRDAEQLYRLKREFRVLTGILHPNLVELYELFVDDRECFFTMELVDGPDIVTYLRGESTRIQSLDYERVRDVLRQLVAGLGELHDAGRLHRDVKPSNVLVTLNGRVVILDFGLTTLLAPESSHESAPGIAGTIAYMAPEQAWGAALAPAADWYSVGVVLYELLTGSLPFDGPPAHVIVDKARLDPQSPRTLNPDIPPELDALVMRLLNREPNLRPVVAEILECLSLHPVRVLQASRRLLGQANVPFVGRERELTQLHTAFESVRCGALETVEVTGPSGIGKTELIRRFLTGLEQHTDVVTLRGRCHPQEAVPYKAFDALIDALSRFLLSVSEQQLAAVAPRYTTALVRMFPVLSRVSGFKVLREPGNDPEAHELRRRGILALRELLTRVGDRYPLVLWIDDAQWGDQDSALLLRELIRPPDVPSMLVVLCYRSDDRVDLASALRQEGDEAGASHSRIISLGPLSESESRALAATLCTVLPNPQVEAVATESRGSPFLLAELARRVVIAAGDLASSSEAQLDFADIIRARVQRLPEPARALLEIVSVAGRPLAPDVALDAAGLQYRGRPVVLRLQQENLLRSTIRGAQLAVEVYHDRIREAVTSRMPADVRRRRHGDIAAALQAKPEADPKDLFLHHLEAGHIEQATRYAEIAADRAAVALAFDQAAELYRNALQAGFVGDVAGINRKLAEALANAGLGPQAGEAFEQAASASSKVDTSTEEVLSLKCSAADQYLRSGLIDRGTMLMRSVLQDLGLPLPRTRRAALLSALGWRTRFILRGTHLAPHATGDISAPTRVRLDAMWVATNALSVLNPLVADAVGVRCLIESMQVGDRGRVIRALGLEAAREAGLGGPLFSRRCARLLEEVNRLAAMSRDPYETAWARQAVGTSAYMQGQWRRAYEHCDAAVTIWRTGSKGAAWEIATGQSFALSSLAHMGEFTQLATRLPEAIADADRRGDVYAGSGLRLGVTNMLWLARDLPEEALRVADDSMGRWPSDTFLLQHYLHLIATVQAHLYRGAAWAAWNCLAAAWPALRRIFILALPFTRVELYHLRARAALAAALCFGSDSTLGRPESAWPRPRLLRFAAAHARKLRRERFPSAPVFSHLIRAGVDCGRARTAHAVQALRAAATAARKCDMALHAAVADYCMGMLLDDRAGEMLVADSETWMKQQGIVCPATMAATLAPGCSVREGNSRNAASSTRT